MKVVINKCFGGFSISLAAARFMAARGNKLAAIEVAEYEAKLADSSLLDNLERKHGVQWRGYGYAEDNDGYDRTDPDLVAAVETLGAAANGELAALHVVEVPDGISWEIDEYDGNERISESHRTWS